MSGPLILAYDIECSPALVWSYDLWPKFIGIDQVVEHPRIISFAAQFEQNGVKKPLVFKSEYHQSRDEMLQTLWDMQDKADYVMGWNSKGFDDKYSMGEFAIEGLGRPSSFQALDLMLVEKANFRLLSRKLDYASIRFLNDRKVGENALHLWLQIKKAEADMAEAERREWWEDYDLAKRRLKRLWDRFRTYNKKDVTLLWDIRDQFLPWVDGLNFNNFTEDGEGVVCSKCGSPDLTKRGVYRTAVSVFQTYRCPSGHQTRALKRDSGAGAR